MEERTKNKKRDERERERERKRTFQYITSQPYTFSRNHKEPTRSGSLILVDDSASVAPDIVTVN